MKGHLARRWGAEITEHFAILAPAGTGKTVLATQGLMPLWSHGIVLDPKGGDDNLQWARRMGARISPTFPRRDVQALWGKDPYPERYYWINPPLRDARRAFADAMSQVWNQGRWVIYTDEIKLLSDPQELALERYLVRFLRYGRGRRITFIGGTQSPRWNGRAMGDLYDQPRWFAIGHTADRRTIDRYGEISGMDTDVAREVLPSLDPHEFWIVGPERFQAVTSYPLRQGRPST